MTHYSSKLFFLCSFIFSLLFISPSWANAEAINTTDDTWHYVNEQGELKIKLYFFWSKTCPHCAEAHPFIDSLPQKYPWITLESHSVSDPGVQDIWQNIANKTATEARSVPYIANCEKAIVGYSSEAVTGEFLVNRLKNCYLSLGGQLTEADMPTKGAANTPNAPMFGTCGSSTSEGTCDASSDSQPEVQPVELPLVGVVTPETMSLPLLTLVLAGVDAFNPCAFFVLLFLLSIMVNAKSRSRMLLVGGIFVFFSGFIYFLFMTA
ncbi:MAG: cytochrome C biosynthesis protein, partial [Shewanella sp.]